MSLVGVLDKKSGVGIRFIGDLFGHQCYHKSL